MAVNALRLEDGVPGDYRRRGRREVPGVWVRWNNDGIFVRGGVLPHDSIEKFLGESGDGRRRLLGYKVINIGIGILPFERGGQHSFVTGQFFLSRVLGYCLDGFAVLPQGSQENCLLQFTA